jgi:hypothetical protein
MNVVAEMLLAEPAVPAIWAVLMLLTFPALLLLGSPNGLRHPGQAARDAVAALRGDGERRLRRAVEVAHAARLADEVRVAADRAAASADRWQECWQESADEVTAAWQRWLDADARLRTMRAAAVFGTPWSAQTCAEYAARERFLHRAVAAAAGRGDLPPAALADAHAGRNGWDARLHPIEQELVIARTSAAWLRQQYETAVATERTNRHDADLARRTRDSLRFEAMDAAARHGILLPARRRTEARAGLRRIAPATA